MDGTTDTLAIFWENVSALMEWYFGGEALGRFAAEVGIAPASMTRFKKKETAVGADVLEKIAGRFQLEPWQLLAPHLGTELYAFGEDRLPRPVPAYRVDIAQELRGAPQVVPPSGDVRPAGSTRWQRTKAGAARAAQKTPPHSTRRKSEK